MIWPRHRHVCVQSVCVCVCLWKSNKKHTYAVQTKAFLNQRTEYYTSYLVLIALTGPMSIHPYIRIRLYYNNTQFFFILLLFSKLKSTEACIIHSCVIWMSRDISTLCNVRIWNYHHHRNCYYYYCIINNDYSRFLLIERKKEKNGVNLRSKNAKSDKRYLF